MDRFKIRLEEYTSMNVDPQIWQIWAKNLHRWGVGDWVASFLEASGPLTLVGAQALYLSQPLLGLFLPEVHLKALANLLEEPTQSESFAALLREGASSETA